jgi:hypothetical protein
MIGANRLGTCKCIFVVWGPRRESSNSLRTLLLEYLLMDEYCMSHIGEDKDVNDPNAYVTNIKQ